MARRSLHGGDDVARKAAFEFLASEKADELLKVLQTLASAGTVTAEVANGLDETFGAGVLALGAAFGYLDEPNPALPEVRGDVLRLIRGKLAQHADPVAPTGIPQFPFNVESGLEQVVPYGNLVSASLDQDTYLKRIVAYITTMLINIKVAGISNTDVILQLVESDYHYRDLVAEFFDKIAAVQEVKDKGFTKEILQTGSTSMTKAIIGMVANELATATESTDTLPEPILGWDDDVELTDAKAVAAYLIAHDVLGTTTVAEKNAMILAALKAMPAKLTVAEKAAGTSGKDLDDLVTAANDNNTLKFYTDASAAAVNDPVRMFFNSKKAEFTAGFIAAASPLETLFNNITVQIDAGAGGNELAANLKDLFGDAAATNPKFISQLRQDAILNFDFFNGTEDTYTQAGGVNKAPPANNGRKYAPYYLYNDKDDRIDQQTNGKATKVVNDPGALFGAVKAYRDVFNALDDKGVMAYVALDHVLNAKLNGDAFDIKGSVLTTKALEAYQLIKARQDAAAIALDEADIAVALARAVINAYDVAASPLAARTAAYKRSDNVLLGNSITYDLYAKLITKAATWKDYINIVNVKTGQAHDLDDTTLTGSTFNANDYRLNARKAETLLGGFFGGAYTATTAIAKLINGISFPAGTIIKIGDNNTVKIDGTTKLSTIFNNVAANVSTGTVTLIGADGNPITIDVVNVVKNAKVSDAQALADIIAGFYKSRLGTEEGDAPSYVDWAEANTAYTKFFQTAVKDPFWVNVPTFDGTGRTDRFERLTADRQGYEPNPDRGQCSLLAGTCTANLRGCLAGPSGKLGTACAAFLSAEAFYGATLQNDASTIEAINNEIKNLDPALGSAILDKFGFKKGPAIPQDIYPFGKTRPEQINRSLYQSVRDWFLSIKNDKKKCSASSAPKAGTALAAIGEDFANQLIDNVEMAKTTPTAPAAKATKFFLRYLNILVQWVNANRNVLNPEELNAPSRTAETPEAIDFKLYAYRVPVVPDYRKDLGIKCKSNDPLGRLLKRFGRDYEDVIRSKKIFRPYNPYVEYNFDGQTGGGAYSALPPYNLSYEQFPENAMKSTVTADELKSSFDKLLHRAKTSGIKPALTDRSKKQIEEQIEKLRVEETRLNEMVLNFARGMTIVNRSSGYVNGFHYGVGTPSGTTEDPALIAARKQLFAKHHDLTRIQSRVELRKNNITKALSTTAEKLFSLGN